MASITNTHGLRVVTGGQSGTNIQFLLIKCYNTAYGTSSTEQNGYQYISEPNDGLAQIVRVVQDFAEIAYIGIPEANSGGENDLTRVIIAINPNTARDIPEGVYPKATGQYDALVSALNDMSGGGAEAWFGIPGNGWNWYYND